MITHAITSQPLLILVGVTGVGKSTTVQTLIKEGLAFHLLPNRRLLTSRLIVAPLLEEEGQPVRELSRMERLPYVRRYRTRYPGGMAHALSKWQIEPAQRGQLFLFDGLRGENEVRYALKAFPLAKFALLHAPDMIRIQRLLKRQDPYDQMGSQAPEQSLNGKTRTADLAPPPPAPPPILGEGTLRERRPPSPSIGGGAGGGGRFREVSRACLPALLFPSAIPDSFAALGVPEAATIFSGQEEQTLFGLVQRGEISLNDLHDKLRLMTVERRLYDANATRRTLESLAPDRTLVIDTSLNLPQQVAQKIMCHVGICTSKE